MANNDITTLIAGLQIVDPKLYQALMQLNARLFDVETELTPLVRQAQEIETTAASVAAPTTFTFAFTSRTVRFNWSDVTGASQFEIRKGTDWDTASFQLRTGSLQADIDALASGTHTFLIKSISSSGSYSSTATQCIVSVPTIGPPVVSTRVIDNNVLLSWVAPSSTFEIVRYNLYKDATPQGSIVGTFTTFFESVAATYTYGVEAVDVAGNVGTLTEVDVIVNQPPDFALQDVRTSDFSGTKNNVKLEGDKLVCNVHTETFEEHFLSRSWVHAQDQVTAGYPIYIQPVPEVGYYEEIVDYGVVLSNVIITITGQQELIYGSFIVTITISVSDDGVTYDTPVAGASRFVASMRFLKFRLTFTAGE